MSRRPSGRFPVQSRSQSSAAVATHRPAAHKLTSRRLVGGMPAIHLAATPPVETREKARELRHAGLTVPEIGEELGLAKSTAWLITKDIGRTPGPSTSARRSNAAKHRWSAYEGQRAVERESACQMTLEQVGEVSDRELGLISG